MVLNDFLALTFSNYKDILIWICSLLVTRGSFPQGYPHFGHKLSENVINVHKYPKRIKFISSTSIKCHYFDGKLTFFGNFLTCCQNVR